MAPEPEKRRRAPRGNGPHIGPVTKLTPEVSDQICEELRFATPLKSAAEKACVDLSTVKHWIKRGKETTDEPYQSFAVAVMQARGAAFCFLQRKALDGGKGSAAAMWTLERRDRENYGPVNRIDQTIDLTMQRLIKAFDPPLEDAEPNDSTIEE
jgi:hypothetical protein